MRYYDDDKPVIIWVFTVLMVAIVVAALALVFLI